MHKLNSFYIFLGEDLFLLERNQDLILNFAYKKGFSEKVIIDIEKDKDWEKVILFYKNKNLFFKKTTLVVNFLIKKLNIVLVKHIHEIFSVLNLDILIILKFNHLSRFIEKNKFLNKFKKFNIVSCFTPYNLHFINWIKYEIQEKNINIEEKAFLLLCKYYEGNTLFIYKILDILLITWPNSCITVEKIKKIIIDFFDLSPLHWINSIFQGQIEKAIYILNHFCKKKYNPLILVRSLQKDLFKLIYIRREKTIITNSLLDKNNIWHTRYKFFKNACKKINNNSLLKAIKILVKIEINIKKKYNTNVWNQLQELTLTLCN
ncbi:DNA polymerase III subunit delta [Buchnera aphidicola (Acyrthosiphon lactucae)]|uniref:DNA polymerase III subunit delta n=1 Tax=Buchnera aphidicola (Acyrthosiphon lactucae) TaxID=1241832 RepID=A0A4D6XW91_9GAMM|nr:DNA polymerase III subunit delta [Buchnera aphidicola]QCI17831.1 DNA polymerase III subunit delta [Buchnera aphidicola (Acyrthosiphon lactucae)]